MLAPHARRVGQRGERRFRSSDNGVLDGLPRGRTVCMGPDGVVRRCRGVGWGPGGTGRRRPVWRRGPGRRGRTADAASRSSPHAPHVQNPRRLSIPPARYRQAQCGGVAARRAYPAPREPLPGVADPLPGGTEFRPKANPRLQTRAASREPATDPPGKHFFVLQTGNDRIIYESDPGKEHPRRAVSGGIWFLFGLPVEELCDNRPAQNHDAGEPLRGWHSVRSAVDGSGR